MLTIPKSPDPLDRSFFFLDKVDHTEICRIIHDHFQRGYYASRSRYVLSNQENSKFVVINFDKAQRISTVTPGLATENHCWNVAFTRAAAGDGPFRLRSLRLRYSRIRIGR
jgi:hypothetical protein